MEHLPVQVGPVHDVAVDEPDLPDAGSGKVEGDRAPKPAGPGDDDPGAREPFLRLLPEERDLPPVAFQFLVREHRSISPPRG